MQNISIANTVSEPLFNLCFLIYFEVELKESKEVIGLQNKDSFFSKDNRDVICYEEVRAEGHSK